MDINEFGEIAEATYNQVHKFLGACHSFGAAQSEEWQSGPKSLQLKAEMDVIDAAADALARISNPFRLAKIIKESKRGG